MSRDSAKMNDRDRYRMCTKCVMDTTDPNIVFDENGICSHCHAYERDIKNNVFTGEEGTKRIKEIVARIREEGKNKEYDCLIGVSGGVDSSFLAYKVKEFGLRPLAVHLDNGWDSAQAASNIRKVLNKLGINLYTHVIDWEEFKDLQLSFLKSSTPDSEIPSDHAIIALMTRMASKIGVRYIISGHNFRTETHLPPAWSQGHFDWRYIKNVHRQFGTLPLKTFPHITPYVFIRYLYLQKWVFLLNYIDYNKTEAMKILENELGWVYYGGKHYESIYTRFYQGYILPVKFGYDKRKAHLSSLICSGEITRDEALEELKKDTYPKEMQEQDKIFLLKKFGITDDEFEAIMNAPKKTYWDYPSYGKIFASPQYKALLNVLKSIRGKKK